MLNVSRFLTFKHCVESSSVTISKSVNVYMCTSASIVVSIIAGLIMCLNDGCD